MKKTFSKIEDELLLVCFARSFDEAHIKRKRIHLASSVVKSSYDVVFSDIDFSFLKEKMEKGMYRSTYYVFNVVDNFNNKDNFPLINLFDNVGKSWSVQVANYFDCVRVINIEFGLLLILLEEADDDNKLNLTNDFLTEFLGTKESTKKNFDSICQDSVFIFRNIDWSYLILLFKIKGIDISGGSNTKRHILSTVDATLKEFLDLFYGYNTNFINKHIIYESFKNKDGYLSSFINLNTYKDMLNFIKELKESFKKELCWREIEIIKSKMSSISNEDWSHFQKVLFDNYINVFSRLVEIWKVLSEEKKIKNLKKNIEKKK